MPEFFYFWTYWLLVALAFAVCLTVGYLVGGAIGATIGGVIYIAHETAVVYFSWPTC